MRSANSTSVLCRSSSMTNIRMSASIYFVSKSLFVSYKRKEQAKHFCNKSISEKKLKGSFLFLFSGGLSIKVYRRKVIRKSWWNLFNKSLHSFDVIGSKPLLECCHHSPDEMHPWLFKSVWLNMNNPKYVLYGLQSELP